MISYHEWGGSSTKHMRDAVAVNIIGESLHEWAKAFIGRNIKYYIIHCMFVGSFADIHWDTNTDWLNILLSWLITLRCFDAQWCLIMLAPRFMLSHIVGKFLTAHILQTNLCHYDGTCSIIIKYDQHIQWIQCRFSSDQTLTRHRWETGPGLSIHIAWMFCL